MRFGPTFAPSRTVTADRLPQSPEPVTCPGKFDAEDCQTNGDNDESGSRRDDHQYTQQQHRCADYSDDEAARGLISEMHRLPDQQSSPSFLILPLLVVALQAWNYLKQ